MGWPYEAHLPPVEPMKPNALLGYVIMLLGGLFAAAMPVLHMRGARYPAIAESSGGFFFVWALLAVGVTGTYSVILSARALWMLRLGKPR